MSTISRMIRSLRSVFVYDEAIANAFYGIACIYSLRGNNRLALQFLEESLQKGFKDMSQIENNTDMKTIRHEYEWKKLIKRYL